MIVGAIIVIFAIIIGVAVLIWGWGKASVEVVGANRAYDAVAAAHYVEPELADTYDVNVDAHCRAADDAVGYRMLATPADGSERVTLTVCCGSTLSSKPCTVRVAGQ